MMQTKSIFESRTIWLNAIVAVLAIYDQVAPFIPPAWVPKIAAIVGVLNIILRLVTTQPVSLSGGE